MRKDCCKCSDDDFDLCMDCYAEGERCRCSKGGLKPIQFAWPGSLFHPNRHEYCDRFEKNLNLICDICLGSITQGRYFRKFMMNLPLHSTQLTKKNVSNVGLHLPEASTFVSTATWTETAADVLKAILFIHSCGPLLRAKKHSTHMRRRESGTLIVGAVALSFSRALSTVSFSYLPYCRRS